jgi:hypothetical protein
MLAIRVYNNEQAYKMAAIDCTVIYTIAIRKVISGELLTKQTTRKNIVIYKKYLHT